MKNWREVEKPEKKQKGKKKVERKIFFFIFFSQDGREEGPKPRKGDEKEKVRRCKGKIYKSNLSLSLSLSPFFFFLFLFSPSALTGF